ncbi:MAG: hypothetical protein Fur0012_06170 [Elusimicrobiota bacterium]
MNDNTELGLYHYKLIFSIEEKIYSIKDEKLLFQTLADDLKNNTSAQMGIVFRLYGSKLTPESCFGLDINMLKDMDFSRQSGYAGWVMEYNLPLKSDNVSTDKRLSSISDPVVGTGIKINSILAVPVIQDKELLGIIELINSSSSFTAQDLRVLTVVARHLAVNLKNRQLTADLSGRCNYLSKIVNNLSSGLLVLEENGKIIISNPKALEILNLAHRPSDLSEIDNELSPSIKTLLKNKKNLSRQELIWKDKVIGYACMTVKDENMENNGIIFLFQDITAYKKVEGK